MVTVTMKTIASGVFFSVLLFAVLDRNPFIQTVDAAHTFPYAVNDTDGNAVRVGLKYYVVQVPYNGGGAITLGRSSKNQICPDNVLLKSESQGVPVTISPYTGRKGVIRSHTDVNIMFTIPSKCGNSTVWKVGDVVSASGQKYLTIGGVKGNPGPDTLTSWFKIEEVGDFYSLFYCPSVCKSCKVDCSDVGFYKDSNGKTHAALSGVPFRIRFKKAS